jgi:hypothetical protein
MEGIRAKARARVLAEFLFKGNFPSTRFQNGTEIYASGVNSTSSNSSSFSGSVMSQGGDSSMLQEALDDATYRKLLKHQATFERSRFEDTAQRLLYGYSIKVDVSRTVLLDNLQVLLGKHGLHNIGIIHKG